MRSVLLALGGAVGAVAVVAVLVGVGGRLEGGGEELLPDLVVKTPYELELTRAGTRWRLGFASAASNLGAGPLIVQGRRRPGATTMATVQVIRRTDGSAREERGVGTLRYVVSSDHQHWHFVPFMRYELHAASGWSPVLRDRKTGFCLGDRYDTNRALPGKPRFHVYTSRCGLRSPGRLGMREGISVGYGDDYDPTLEGQFVDVTGLAAGRYVLVHRVNETGALQESRSDNNASSLLIRLSWRDGRPSVEQLRRCPGAENCAVG
jgi:Lysyl oxidase